MKNLLRSVLSMDSLWFLLGLTVFSSVVCLAQSPSDGYVEAHAYVNSYLHFTYAWPTMLQPYDIAELNIHPAHPNPNESMLFAARQGNAPYGIIMIAEKLHVPTQHNPTGFKDGAQFLSNVAYGWPPEANFKFLDSKHSTTIDGLPLDEYNYTVNNEFDSGIAIQIGQYIVVFKCNAKSPSDLAIMNKSILATHLNK